MLILRPAFESIIAYIVYKSALDRVLVPVLGKTVKKHLQRGSVYTVFLFRQKIVSILLTTKSTTSKLRVVVFLEITQI